MKKKRFCPPPGGAQEGPEPPPTALAALRLSPFPPALPRRKQKFTPCHGAIPGQTRRERRRLPLPQGGRRGRGSTPVSEGGRGLRGSTSASPGAGRPRWGLRGGPAGSEVCRRVAERGQKQTGMGKDRRQDKGWKNTACLMSKPLYLS